MNDITSYRNVNLADPRQDVHRIRAEQPALNRYRVAETLLADVPRNACILDVGGGAAEFSRQMQALGFNVTFVDLSEANVQRARTFALESYQIDLNCGLPGLADARFDAVVMLEIIEHVVAAEQLLTEASRVLKPGGCLILSTPNFAYWCNRLRILAGRLSQDEGYHYRFFTPAILCRRLKVNGLQIVQTAHTTPAFGYNFIASKLLRRPRRHIHVPNLFASLLAHTLIVKCVKR